MIPDFSQLFECPFCGEKKEVLSLMSGNTIGGHQWSDTKGEYPMLPQLSPILKCPSCAKYFFTRNAKRSEGENYSMDTGSLSLEELIEAETQFGDDLDEKKRLILNIEILYAYNDIYNRESRSYKLPGEQEQSFINRICGQLIECDDLDPILRIELLRESGRFDEAVALANDMEVNTGIANIVSSIKERALKRDSSVFLLW